MPKKIQMTTKEYIVNAPLPAQTDSYTVISHDFIIKEAHKLFAANNLEVEKELYSCNVNAEIARGIFHLKSTTDSELGLSFAWVNSYDKSTKFRCSVAGNILISGAMMMAHDTGSYIRKHTGTADTDVLQSMEDQINNTTSYFDNLTKVKEAMKQIIVPEKRRAELLGLMYIYNQILTSDQLNVVKKELTKPSFNYNVKDDTLWFMYCSIAHAINQAHPKTWMEQHSMLYLILHNNFQDEFDRLASPATTLLVAETDDVVEESASSIPPGQLTIFDMIPQEEPTETVESPDVPLTEVVEETISAPLGEVVSEEIIEEPQQELKDPEPVVESGQFSEMEKLESIAEDSPPLTDLLPEVKEEVIEEVVEEVVEEVIEGWVCLECGKASTFDEVMYEGQLCEECFEKSVK